jgi:SAM-dependent methyltransferase
MKRVDASLDDPNRISEIRRTIVTKPGLRLFYLEIYRKYRECMNRCPTEGRALELGSGGGFVKEVIPEIITSDLVPYEGIDRLVDATHLPFLDRSLRIICMLNVFHHIPDVARFFEEAQRCLVPGGKIFIHDQHLGWISGPILRHFHHEPCRSNASDWSFQSSGPVSGANGALAWIVFKRDLDHFQARFPGLKLEKYLPHSPLRYWLAGGLRPWSLIPGPAVFSAASRLDEALLKISQNFGSFVDIELTRIPS